MTVILPCAHNFPKIQDLDFIQHTIFIKEQYPAAMEMEILSFYQYMVIDIYLKKNISEYGYLS